LYCILGSDGGDITLLRCIFCSSASFSFSTCSIILLMVVIPLVVISLLILSWLLLPAVVIMLFVLCCCVCVLELICGKNESPVLSLRFSGSLNVSPPS